MSAANRKENGKLANYSSVQQKCSYLSTGNVISVKGNELEVHNRAFSSPYTKTRYILLTAK